jgi:hypothetical protein
MGVGHGFPRALKSDIRFEPKQMADDDDDDRMERQLWFGRAVHVYQIPSRESASRGYRCLHVVWKCV